MKRFNDAINKIIFEQAEDHTRYNYMLLSRLITDVPYFLKHPMLKFLWAGSIDGQYEKMKELYNSFADDEKPEWTSLDQIEKLYEQMKQVTVIESTPISTWQDRIHGKF